MSGATWLASAALEGQAVIDAGLGWWQAFIGLIPGSMGETSTLACVAGALLLVMTGVGSWRIMVSVAVGTIAAASLLNAVGSTTNPFFDVPFWWHFVLGGWAFGAVYMATEPVTAPGTNGGRNRLRVLDWRARDLDPRREPGLPRRHDAGDPVHERLRPRYRPLRDPGEREAAPGAVR